MTSCWNHLPLYKKTKHLHCFQWIFNHTRHNPPNGKRDFFPTKQVSTAGFNFIDSKLPTGTSEKPSEKGPTSPIGKDRLPVPSIFQGRTEKPSLKVTFFAPEFMDGFQYFLVSFWGFGLFSLFLGAFAVSFTGG